MYERATFAIDVSRSSMNVASVTVMAMNHGLTEDRLLAGFAFDIKARQRTSTVGSTDIPGRRLCSES